eukprot:s2552_g2.t1
MALTLRQSLVLYGLFMVLAVAGVTYFVQTAPPLPEAQCANIVTPMDVVRGKLVCISAMVHQMFSENIPIFCSHARIHPASGHGIPPMKSPSSLCSGSPGASSLSSEDAERIQKMERRILGAAHFQVERDVLEEFRYRDYEQKLQAEERTWQAGAGEFIYDGTGADQHRMKGITWVLVLSLFMVLTWLPCSQSLSFLFLGGLEHQAQLSTTQKLRAEAAQRRKAQHEEVEDRRKQMQGHVAHAREAKVSDQDASSARRARELREAQRKRMEDGRERRNEQLERSKEMAGRLKSMEDQKQVLHEQKLRAEKEKHARLQEKEQQKAEARWQVLQIWQRSEELRKYANQMLAAGHHDELFQELQEMRLELNSPSPFSFAGSPNSSSSVSPSTGSRTGFAPPTRANRRKEKPNSPTPGPEKLSSPLEEVVADAEPMADGTYETLMNLFEAKVCGQAEGGAQRFQWAK